MKSPFVQAAEPFAASRDPDTEAPREEIEDHQTSAADHDERQNGSLDIISRQSTHRSHARRDVEKGDDLELTRTISTRLSRVASRITTRDIVDPGPPPDGGVRAWVQVGMAFLLVSTTWGYVNSFGRFSSFTLVPRCWVLVTWENVFADPVASQESSRLTTLAPSASRRVPSPGSDPCSCGCCSSCPPSPAGLWTPGCIVRRSGSGPWCSCSASS